MGTVSPGGRHTWDGEPLWLDAAAVLTAARERFGVSPSAASLLAGGLLNQTWRLSCGDHDRTLRVSRSERTTEQVGYEHAFATVVAGVAPVVVAETTEVPVVGGRALSLYPFVAGRPGTAVAPEVRTEATVVALAAMHRASLAAMMPQRPGFVSADEVDDWYGWEPLRAGLVGDADAELSRAITTVQQTVDELREWLAVLHTSGRLAVRGTVHGDLNARNLLFGSDDELVAIIDVDDCRVEPLVWEIAGQAYSSGTVSPATVWRTYRDAGGPLPDADEDLLLGCARLGALSELRWWLQDGRPTDRARQGVIDLARQLTHGVTRDD